MARKRKEVVYVSPAEVLCAVGEWVRRHKDPRPGGGPFSYYVSLLENGGARIELGPKPTKAQAKKLEAQLRQKAAEGDTEVVDVTAKKMLLH